MLILTLYEIIQGVFSFKWLCRFPNIQKPCYSGLHFIIFLKNQTLRGDVNFTVQQAVYIGLISVRIRQFFSLNTHFNEEDYLLIGTLVLFFLSMLILPNTCMVGLY